MTDLTGKFGTIAAKLDTIIDRLDGLTTAVSASGGNADIVDAINDAIGRLDTSQSMDGSRNVLLASILSAIGDIAGYPPNYTVRRLLAMLQTTLDEAPPTLSVPGIFTCRSVSSGWIGCTGYGYIGAVTYDGGYRTAYSPKFGSNLDEYGMTGLFNAENQRSLYRHGGTTPGNISVGWEFASATPNATLLCRAQTLSGTSELWYPEINADGYLVLSSDMSISDCVSVETNAIQTTIGTGDTIIELFVLYEGLLGGSGSPPTQLYIGQSYVGGGGGT